MVGFVAIVIASCLAMAWAAPAHRLIKTREVVATYVRDALIVHEQLKTNGSELEVLYRHDDVKLDPQDGCIGDMEGCPTMLPGGWRKVASFLTATNLIVETACPRSIREMILATKLRSSL